MNKSEKFLIYVPIIGIIILIIILNSDNIRYENVHYDDIKNSVWVQTISVIYFCAMIGLCIDKIIIVWKIIMEFYFVFIL